MHMLLIDGKIAKGKKDEFIKAWSSRILPFLKKQNGFVDEILLFDPATESQAVGLCFWKTQEQAERHQRELFPQIKSFVEHLIVGAPTLRSFEVEASATFGIGAKAA